MTTSPMPADPRFIDLTGRTFGRLTVEGYGGQASGRESLWACRCSCGKRVTVRKGCLRDGDTQSCGCLRAELNKLSGRKHRTHGLHGAPEYRVWVGMVQRCAARNAGRKKYAGYAGRGIKVCQRWRESFAAFYADMGPRPSPKHSIDRINNDGDYEPGNCRWATASQQACNKRVNAVHGLRKGNHVLTFNGSTRCLSEWARLTGIGRMTIQYRLWRGWSVEDALTRPVDESRSPTPKLNEEKVGTLWDLHRAGFSQVKIARLLHVSAGAVQQVIEGKTWRYVRPPA
jgi:hypothetical protein